MARRAQRAPLTPCWCVAAGLCVGVERAELFMFAERRCREVKVGIWSWCGAWIDGSKQQQHSASQTKRRGGEGLENETDCRKW